MGHHSTPPIPLFSLFLFPTTPVTVSRSSVPRWTWGGFRALAGSLAQPCPFPSPAHRTWGRTPDPVTERIHLMLTERQRQANEFAALLRKLGYSIPVGSCLFGREVTR